MDIQKKKTIQIYLLVVSHLVSIGTVSYLLMVVVPKFIEMFKTLNIVIPFIAKIIFSASYSMRGYWWLVVPLVSIIVLGVDGLLLFPYIKSDKANKWVIIFNILTILVVAIIIIMIVMGIFLPMNMMENQLNTIKK
jgi:type II secretory pathway component PulF